MLEYELKLKNINKVIFDVILNNNKEKKYKRELSVNYIYTGETYCNHIKKIIYSNEPNVIKDEIIYYDKRRLKSHFINNEYIFNDTSISVAITMSKETIKQHIENKLLSRIRIKDRLSFMLDDKWRLDMTMIITKRPECNSVELIVSKFFNNKNNIDNFTKRENIAVNDIEYEIELEYIGDTNKIDFNDIVKQSESILKHVNLYKNLYTMFYSLITNSINTDIKITHNKVLNYAVTLDLYTYVSSNLLLFQDYLITDKIDGERALLMINNETIMLFYSNRNIENTININDTRHTLILDCEVIEKNDNTHIHVFDVLHYDGVRVMDKSYVDRLGYFGKCKKITDNNEIKNYFKIHYKEFEIINNYNEKYKLKTLAHKFYTDNNKNNVDGLIISTSNLNYRNTINYKWKPSNKSTIDFYCERDKSGGHTDYKIYVAINIYNYSKFYLDFDDTRDIVGKNTHKHILFKPMFNRNDNKLKTNELVDKKIVELIKINNKWVYVKTRHDKIKANDYIVAEQIYSGYYKPFTIEMLYDLNDDNYFKTNINDDTLKYYKEWNNGVKYYYYHTYNFKNCKLLDLGAGRGTDINKYSMFELNTVYMVDNDEMSFQELVNGRLFNVIKNKKITKIPKINLFNIDLTDDYTNVIDKFNQRGIDTNNMVNRVVISFSIHYFAYNNDKLNNLVNLLYKVLENKGIVIITFLNGFDVANLLNDNKGEWFVPDKYHIKTDFYKLKENIKNNNVEINIKLPFSNDKFYTEKLIKPTSLKKKFEESGFTTILNTSFINLKDEIYFKNEDKLTEEDKIYIKLHHIMVFRKKNT